MEPPPAYAPGYSDPNGGAAYGNLRAEQPTAPMAQAPVAQPVAQAQYAQPVAQAQYGQPQAYAQPVTQGYGGQPVMAQPVYAQQNPTVVVVHGNDSGCCAIACFVLGWFFFFPWFGCYCADGGVCSDSPTAKCFNILSLVMLILTLVAIIATTVAVVAVVGACNSCADCPRMCSGCSDCVKYHTYCTTMFDAQFEAQMGGGGDSTDLDIQGKCVMGDERDEAQGRWSCFNNREVCIGGTMGGFMEAMTGSRCDKVENMGDDVTAQNLCFAHDAMQDGYFDGGQGGETGSGSGSSGPPPADGILTSTCRDSVLSNFGSLDCEPSDNCDTCDFLGYCIGCREGYELDVIFSDCTGYCVLKSDFVAGYHKSMKTALADNYCSHPSDLQCVEDQMSAVSSPAA